MKPPLIQIRDWSKHYEKAQSRVPEFCAWVPIPNKVSGEGYRRLVEGPNGPAHLGIFLALVELVSRQRRPRDGWITEDGKRTGRPLTVEEIAAHSGLLPTMSGAHSAGVLSLIAETLLIAGGGEKSWLLIAGDTGYIRGYVNVVKRSINLDGENRAAHSGVKESCAKRIQTKRQEDKETEEEELESFPESVKGAHSDPNSGRQGFENGNTGPEILNELVGYFCYEEPRNIAGFVMRQKNEPGSEINLARALEICREWWDEDRDCRRPISDWWEFKKIYARLKNGESLWSIQGDPEPLDPDAGMTPEQISERQARRQCVADWHRKAVEAARAKREAEKNEKTNRARNGETA